MTGQLPPFTTADFKWKPIWKILVATDFPVRKVFEGWGIPHLKKKWDGCLDDQQEKSCDELANFFAYPLLAFHNEFLTSSFSF